MRLPPGLACIRHPLSRRWMAGVQRGSGPWPRLVPNVAVLGHCRALLSDRRTSGAGISASIWCPRANRSSTFNVNSFLRTTQPEP